MLRAVVGFGAGVIVWMPAFFILAGLGNLIWAEYTIHAQTWFNESVFTFPAAMAAYTAACWAVAEVLAGWVAVAVGRRRQAAWVLAAAVALYMAVNHLILFWASFPWWYNLAVALAAAPAVLLGGRLADRFVRLPAAVVAG
jgi:MFS family permease